MQYTQTELAKLIETVETEFSGYLAKSEASNSAAAPLAKAEDAKPEDKKEEKAPESKEEAKPEHKEPAKEEKEAPKADEKAPEHKEEAKADEKAPASEEAPKADAAAEEHGYDEEDMKHMHEMYASMSNSERKAHHDAIMKCAMAEKAPEHAMEKSEDTKTAETVEVPADIQTTPDTNLLKSELEAAKAEKEELKKNLDGVKEFLTALVKKVPQGKAITSLDVIAKSEGSQEEKQLNKSEVTAILMKKASDPKLEKSDREAINQFYATGQVNFNTISHLLK
jgi:hypothetical protein